MSVEYENKEKGNSLSVHWLRLGAFTAFGRLRCQGVCSNVPLTVVGPQWHVAVQRYKPRGEMRYLHTHTHSLSLHLWKSLLCISLLCFLWGLQSLSTCMTSSQAHRANHVDG